MVDAGVPVGFQGIDASVRLDPAPGTDPAQFDKLAAAAERCCVVLQTLRGGVPVQAVFHRKP
jgi:organic hydroperoxide reductase OsmC/OhrA